MKTIEELNALKTEFEAVKGKLEGLSEEELETVTGGRYPWIHQRIARKEKFIPDNDIRRKLKGFSDEELKQVNGGHSDYPEIAVITTDCSQCGLCAMECPAAAIHDRGGYFVDANDCIGCGICRNYCQFDAIRIIHK